MHSKTLFIGCMMWAIAGTTLAAKPADTPGKNNGNQAQPAAKKNKDRGKGNDDAELPPQADREHNMRGGCGQGRFGQNPNKTNCPRSPS